MRETIDQRYGFRRPDGKISGWWPSRNLRDQAVRKYLDEAKRLGLTATADLVTQVVTTTRRNTVERTVRS